MSPACDSAAPPVITSDAFPMISFPIVLTLGFLNSLLGDAMKFNEKVMMRALLQKQVNEEGGVSHSGDVVETLAQQERAKLRNMCAHVTPEFYDEVSYICAALHMSKREFVTSALKDAVATANEIMESTGLNASIVAALATEDHITVEEA